MFDKSTSRQVDKLTSRQVEKPIVRWHKRPTFRCLYYWPIIFLGQMSIDQRKSHLGKIRGGKKSWRENEQRWQTVRQKTGISKTRVSFLVQPIFRWQLSRGFAFERFNLLCCRRLKLLLQGLPEYRLLTGARPCSQNGSKPFFTLTGDEGSYRPPRSVS